MTESNPYESPTAAIDPEEPISKFSFASLLLTFVVFSVVSFQTFLVVILTFFGKSSAYWPGFLCGGIGVLAGIFAARLTLRTNLIRRVGWASLLAASLSMFLVIFALTMQNHPENISEFFLPASLSNMGIGHKLILSFSGLGAFFGIWGLILGIVTRRVPAMLVGGGFGFLCTCHLIAVAIRLAS